MAVTVLGGGSWGTALAQQASRNGHAVTVWAREAEVVDGINGGHVNPLFLDGVPLSPRVKATSDITASVRGAEMVLIVIPSQFVRSHVVRLRDHLPTGAPIVICSKGIENATLATLDQVLEEELPGKYHKQISVLSGPSFAREVGLGMPTNMTVAARDRDAALAVQRAMSTKRFRIYTSSDVVGVETGGALKNVIAIAAGACDGLGLGTNGRAGLITRGLTEMARLAVGMGGRPETLFGLSGLGDLVLTCTGELSRNRRFGMQLAAGKTVAQIQADMHMVAEGVPTSRSVQALAAKLGIDMPISHQTYQVVHEGKSVRDAMDTLQSRRPRDEWSIEADVAPPV
ncbi:MAG: glycerol-3-phosphate dehydrogenase [Proteobacteria bacterium]|nr:MAG: glycerol-3-phosphate dehydrogenase [Pseudomonadota bacterium]